MRYVPIAQRFWSKVNKDGPIPSHMPHLGKCWQWLGSIGTTTRGIIKEYGGKTLLAHRFSWTLHNGIIPDGLFVCHHCDNGLCVRPDHLFLGTRRDNALDAVAKHRMINHVGEKNGSSKITSGQVLEIRENKDGLTLFQAAAKYGMGHSQIANIRNRDSWKWLKEKVHD